MAIPKTQIYFHSGKNINGHVSHTPKDQNALIAPKM